MFLRLTVSPGSRAVLCWGSEQRWSQTHPCTSQSQVGPAAGTGKENLTYGLSCGYKLHFLSIFAPWQDLQADAKPPGRFKITHTSRCEEVNTICQKYKHGRFQRAPGAQVCVDKAWEMSQWCHLLWGGAGPAAVPVLCREAPSDSSHPCPLPRAWHPKPGAGNVLPASSALWTLTAWEALLCCCA